MGWMREKNVPWEMEACEPHFEGNVGFMQILWQMSHKEKA